MAKDKTVKTIDPNWCDKYRHSCGQLADAEDAERDACARTIWASRGLARTVAGDKLFERLAAEIRARGGG